MIARREFITLLGGAAAWPVLARAQQNVMPVVGFLDTGTPDAIAPFLAAFQRGLSEAGFDNGRNVVIEYRWGEGDNDRLPRLASELVHRGVAVLATVNTPSALAAKMATQTIPIVFAVGVDPVEFGLAASLSHPGGNLTGVTQLNVEMDAKRLQLLKELVPGAESIGLLINPTNPAYSAAVTHEAEAAARVLNVKLLVLKASSESSIEAGFVSLMQDGAGALLVSGDSLFVAQRDQLVAQAARHRMPTMYHRREFTIAGGLVSYGPSLSEAYHLVGDYTGRILKGEKPGELPVQQSTRFDLAINLKIARELGIDVPTSILLRADEVIE